MTPPEPTATPALHRAWDLRRFGDSAALVTPTGTVSYAELADRVDRFARDVLGPTRRLVVLELANDLDSVVAWLASVQGGHVALVVPPGRSADVIEAYDPDLVIGGVIGGGVHLRRDGSAHDLHPELALLLSTSGSTGSPRLVRLSGTNVTSNASAIADYLGLRPDDRAITSLPLHYCYGLSVLNSHLSVGAAVVLTELSVVDACFWELVDRARVSTLSAVPHSIDLLEHSGFLDRRHPSLRRITQAGGRLPAERVRAWARAGATRGFDLYVMYGQTEATARMAWLPPELAASHPESVGVAIPGASLRIAEDGEVIFSGPNVMMGYASTPADLGRGSELDELPTGDLGQLRDGLLEITGRKARRAKVFGLRIDLDLLERHLETHAVVAGERIRLVSTDRDASPSGLAERAASFCGVPSSAIEVLHLPEIPRLGNGKPDYAGLSALPAPESEETSDLGVHAAYALVVGRTDVSDTDTFVGLGGDSLSYVELATRLEALLDRALPADWHLRPVGALAAIRETPRGRPLLRCSRLDSTIALRALAIVLIVASHVDLVSLEGGAHVLLALAGFNFARFQLNAATRRARVSNGLIGLAQLVVPSVLWIGAVAVLLDSYRLPTVLFLNGVLGSNEWDDQWQFWFLEALVWLLAACLALLAIDRVDRVERQHSFAFAMTLLGLTAVVRYVSVGLQAGATERYSTSVVAFFFMLGWAAARATTVRERCLVSLAGLVLVAGFFGQPQRELIVILGIMVMLWLPTLPLPRALARVCVTIAGASLFIYVTQWQVYPWLEDAGHRWAALFAALLVGIAYAAAMRPVQRAIRRYGVTLLNRSDHGR